MAGTTRGLRLESNPFFNLDLGRHGKAAFRDWLAYDRSRTCKPGPTCKAHQNVTWFRPTVGAYCGPDCRCVITLDGRDTGPAAGYTPEWSAGEDGPAIPAAAFAPTVDLVKATLAGYTARRHATVIAEVNDDDSTPHEGEIDMSLVNPPHAHAYEYVAHFGAPGIGTLVRCACGEERAKVRGTLHRLEDQAHIGRPGDFR